MAPARVRLRALRAEDRQVLFDWINDPQLLVKNAAYRPTAQLNHDEWFSNVTRRSDAVLFAIEQPPVPDAIGTCQLLNIHPVFRSADLQIRIGNSAMLGQGLGSEAVELLVDHGFRHLNLHRIALQVFATNVRAVKAYEKCGFLHEGRLRDAAFIDGDWVDVLCMARLREQRG